MQRFVGTGPRAYQYVHHLEERRTRKEALMREDGFSRHVECADLRLTKRLADVLERIDRESQDPKWSRQGTQRGRGFGDLGQSHQPEVAEHAQSGANPGDVVKADYMGIPLATDDVMGSEGKREIEDVEGSGAQKLECEFNVEKEKTEFDACEIFSAPDGKRSGFTWRVLVEHTKGGRAHKQVLELLGKEGSSQVDHPLGEETDAASHCITSF